MALTANTFATYESVGNREDLSNEIYRIDPTDTPFMTAADRETATAVNHEWQIQTLLAANGANAVLEGNEFVITAVQPTVRRGNICQISTANARVTGTERAVERAGRGDELDYQVMLKGLELKRDMETILLSNQAKVAGADGTARKTASVLSWIKTNTNKGGGAGADPAAADGTGTRTDGTQRAFTEILLKDVLQKQVTAGGKARESTIFTGTFNKQTFSTFTGRATPTEDTRAKKITASVVEYDSDFGLLDIVYDLFMRTRDVLVLQMDMWALAYLKGRKFVSLTPGLTGDSEQRVIISEYDLVARNEASSGGVFDLTTS